MLRLYRPYVVTLVLLTAPSARAADGWPVPRGPSREPVPVSFDRKVLDAAPKDFLDDAAACTLYSGNYYLLEADGTVENAVEMMRARLRSQELFHNCSAWDG